jgi:hypothetical protein
VKFVHQTQAQPQAVEFSIRFEDKASAMGCTEFSGGTDGAVERNWN